MIASRAHAQRTMNNAYFVPALHTVQSRVEMLRKLLVNNEMQQE
jgi:hypothetical protein